MCVPEGFQAAVYAEVRSKKGRTGLMGVSVWPHGELCAGAVSGLHASSQAHVQTGNKTRWVFGP